ncbi:hypothetical protein FQA47_005727 [Oryzias melastigma]|uniref:Uncharacterized protein n=1 Tax=Oryzias melastigma TaxID=30732 RepID=A0A834FUM9_ORYME|nr:hypothetical protein FQA47_005727 [Oryzias melastigma]
MLRSASRPEPLSLLRLDPLSGRFGLRTRAGGTRRLHGAVGSVWPACEPPDRPERAGKHCGSGMLRTPEPHAVTSTALCPHAPLTLSGVEVKLPRVAAVLGVLTQCYQRAELRPPPLTEPNRPQRTEARLQPHTADTAAAGQTRTSARISARCLLIITA